ncbi:hypothetical protein G8O24_08015 [Bradyrhizobium sp. INPA01-394B]|uniref:Nucleoside phosphorylase domain-containing protein n=1 Tax=Bradyrhizobium campsiandrae TaxID=1729892 RepID=A0ABR7UCP4_9BRAD|nr:hypothetical protein [Bradyrhizobium campsiandrae]MBC9877290.1 hypothetical protein [Bradyrhizobium campsiandrae]MBC9981390.1 hypothetical protein [Bradyrhizobium campsiandrae]
MNFDPQDIGLKIIEFDPAHPQPGFFSTATEMAAALAAGLMAKPVQYPAHLAPTLDTPAVSPDPSDPLPKADVVIVTWTAAEAETLATLLTPGASFDTWYQYKSNLGHYIPLVTGAKAPFNNRKSSRFFQSLGLYYPIKLVGKRVICLKSGLHLDHDTYNPGTPAPATLPMLDLWKQIIAETRAELIVTTGTGGAIGANVLLGDAVVAKATVFNCTRQFAGKPFRNASYPTTALPASFALPPAAMLNVNAALVAESGDQQHPGGVPVIFHDGSVVADPKIVTTDTFAFDNTTNSAGLQGLGQACDMGDASLGLIISELGQGAPEWAAIRNASDPQIDGTLTPKEQGDIAYHTYTKYGGVTSAASVLAAWSLICARYPAQAPAAVTLAAAAPVHPSVAMESLRRRAVRSTPSHLLLQIAAGSDFSTKQLDAKDIPAEVAKALEQVTGGTSVDLRSSAINWRRISFVDDASTRIQLYLGHVSCDVPAAFRGSYLFSGASLVAKEEFVSS